MDNTSEPKKPKKSILGLSRGQYRGVVIYEVPGGFGFFLGVWYCLQEKLSAATAYIDQWYDLKRN